MLMVRRRLRPGQGGNRPQVKFFPGFRKWTVENWHLSSRRRHQPPSAVPLYNDRVPFVIRDFKAEDFEALWRLDQECFPPGISYSRQELKVYIRGRESFTLVASDQSNQIAGFIVVHGGMTGHVITIDVMAAARRSGVGSLLLQAAEERLRADGSSAVGLETAVDNLAALSFYKRHGYSVIRTWPRYYSNGVDALVLNKELASRP